MLYKPSILQIRGQSNCGLLKFTRAHDKCNVGFAKGAKGGRHCLEPLHLK
jgi:hypothetical protein